jgi:gliding motility-associated-like protein
MDVPAEFLSLDNYLVSANGDGINDTLVIPELLELSPNNYLEIYNRFGQKVFAQRNYTNQFGGYANVDNLVIDKEQGLPADVYFYIVDMEDVNLDFQGFLYLTR